MISHHVFAKKIKHDQPFYADDQVRWNRYAKGLTGPTDLQPDPVEGLIKIDWPTKREPAKTFRKETTTS